jgi:hypothetical protein
MDILFYFKLVVQFVYQKGLRLFEAIYCPRVVGAYRPKQGTWSNFSHEVIWAVPPALYKTPATEKEIQEVVQKVGCLVH